MWKVDTFWHTDRYWHDLATMLSLTKATPKQKMWTYWNRHKSSTTWDFLTMFSIHMNVDKIPTKELPNATFPWPRQCRGLNVTVSENTMALGTFGYVSHTLICFTHILILTKFSQWSCQMPILLTEAYCRKATEIIKFKLVKQLWRPKVHPSDSWFFIGFLLERAAAYLSVTLPFPTLGGFIYFHGRQLWQYCFAFLRKGGLTEQERICAPAPLEVNDFRRDL